MFKLRIICLFIEQSLIIPYFRRSVKYKHRYSDVLSSQETLEENILSPSGYSVQQETINPDDASPDRELADAALQETELAGE